MLPPLSFPFFSFWKRKWVLVVLLVLGVNTKFCAATQPISGVAFTDSAMQVAFPSQQLGTISLTPKDPCGNVNSAYTTNVSIQAINEVDPVTGTVEQFLSLNSSDTQYSFSNNSNTNEQTFSLQFTAISSASILQNVTLSFLLTSDNVTLIFASEFSYFVPAGSLQWTVDIDQWHFLSPNNLISLNIAITPAKPFSFLQRSPKTALNPNVTTSVFVNSDVQFSLGTLDVAFLDNSAVEDVTMSIPSFTEVEITYPHFVTSAVYGMNCQLMLTSSAQSQFNCNPSKDNTYNERLYSSIFVSILVAFVFLLLVAGVIGLWWFLAKHDNWDVYTGVDGAVVGGSSNDEDEEEGEEDEEDVEGEEEEEEDEEDRGIEREEDEGVEGNGDASVEYLDGGSSTSEAESATSKTSGSAESLMGGERRGDAAHQFAFEDLFRMHLGHMRGGAGGSGPGWGMAPPAQAGAGERNIEMARFDGRKGVVPPRGKTRRKKKKKPKSEVVIAADEVERGEKPLRTKKKKRGAKGKAKVKKEMVDVELGEA